MSSSEIEERDRLEACLGSIENNLQAIGARLNDYARDIQDSKVVAMERHDQEPQVVVCKRQSEAAARIAAEIEDFRSSAHKSLAIIAKTQKQADRRTGS